MEYFHYIKNKIKSKLKKIAPIFECVRIFVQTDASKCEKTFDVVPSRTEIIMNTLMVFLRFCCFFLLNKSNKLMMQSNNGI